MKNVFSFKSRTNSFIYICIMTPVLANHGLPQSSHYDWSKSATVTTLRKFIGIHRFLSLNSQILFLWK